MAAVPSPLIFAIPPRGTLPISKGGDIVVDFRQKIDGVYTDYSPGVVVKLEIDTSPQVISVNAAITTYHAVCRVESDAADGVHEGTTWRCIVSYPTIPTTEVIAMNGITVRADS